MSYPLGATYATPTGKGVPFRFEWLNVDNIHAGQQWRARFARLLSGPEPLRRMYTEIRAIERRRRINPTPATRIVSVTVTQWQIPGGPDLLPCYRTVATGRYRGHQVAHIIMVTTADARGQVLEAAQRFGERAAA